MTAKFRYCKLEHIHTIVDEVIEDVDEEKNFENAKSRARAKLDQDCTEEHRKDDCYIKFRCGVHGCFSEITLNYTKKGNVTLRGCVNHQGNCVTS